ncbi:MAG: 4-(cytidine 5'-diphospho)-2-C-methyl-D-erythritol kinase [Oscillospiraceae bacterium]|jgi:4-diphosphocytidyl-2-C-methyl-D-erythritol kinase|nr:4-(cytidine 5'-diphospho)-2-C-methyl-D-erythritol kinase [Oscillospiraceae bacterium]
MNSITVQAPAKINVGLDVLEPTDDDYHLIRTVMQAIDLCDLITIKKNSLNQINLSSSPEITLDVSQNLAYKAAQLFFKEQEIEDYGVDIYIEKFIPVGSGLAGGSTDAAGVLVGLNKLYVAELSVEELCNMALKLGADVPFCVCGGIKLADGIGEIFTPLPNLPECYFVIVKPNESVSSKETFKLCEEMEFANRPDIDGLVAGIFTQNLAEMAQHMKNVFEKVVNIGEIAKIKKQMVESGALGASMTGSGSAVFGLFDNKTKARRCARDFEEDYKFVFLSVPIDCGATVVEEEI